MACQSSSLHARSRRTDLRPARRVFPTCAPIPAYLLLVLWLSAQRRGRRHCRSPSPPTDAPRAARAPHNATDREKRDAEAATHLGDSQSSTKLNPHFLWQAIESMRQLGVLSAFKAFINWRFSVNYSNNPSSPHLLLFVYGTHWRSRFFFLSPVGHLPV